MVPLRNPSSLGPMQQACVVEEATLLKWLDYFKAQVNALGRLNAFCPGVYVEATTPYETQEGHIKVVGQVHRQA